MYPRMSLVRGTNTKISACSARSIVLFLYPTFFKMAPPSMIAMTGDPVPSLAPLAMQVHIHIGLYTHAYTQAYIMFSLSN